MINLFLMSISNSHLNFYFSSHNLFWYLNFILWIIIKHQKKGTFLRGEIHLGKDQIIPAGRFVRRNKDQIIPAGRFVRRNEDQIIPVGRFVRNNNDQNNNDQKDQIEEIEKPSVGF